MKILAKTELSAVIILLSVVSGIYGYGFLKWLQINLFNRPGYVLYSDKNILGVMSVMIAVIVAFFVGIILDKAMEKITPVLYKLTREDVKKYGYADDSHLMRVAYGAFTLVLISLIIISGFFYNYMLVSEDKIIISQYQLFPSKTEKIFSISDIGIKSDEDRGRLSYRFIATD